MAKKGGKQKSEGKTAKKRGKANNFNRILAGIVILFLGGVFYTGISGYNRNQAIMSSSNKGNPDLKETRAVLPASIWRGTTKEAYRLAALIPEVLDEVYCYCDCSRNPRFNHKNLLTCFTDDHGANCDICQRELFYSYDLHKKGKSKKEIKEAIDREFSKKNFIG